MKFIFALLPIVAALRFVEASPIAAESAFTKRFPVPITNIFCEEYGSQFVCTASSDGHWVAQWDTLLFQKGLFGLTQAKITSMKPLPVTSIECNVQTNICTADLHSPGTGVMYVAQWFSSVYHVALFSQKEVVNALAPVPVGKLDCDGDSQSCIAQLKYGDGKWVAEWPAEFVHHSLKKGF